MIEPNGQQKEEPKQKFELKLIAWLWSWKKYLFPHSGKQRWSDDDKNIVEKTLIYLVRGGSLLLLVGFVLGICAVFFVKGVIIGYFVDLHNQKQIVYRITKVNKELDPCIAKAIAQTMMSMSGPFDYRVLLGVGEAESMYHLYAKSHKGAEGLYQLLPRTQDGITLTETKRYWIEPQTFRAVKELEQCHKLSGTFKGMMLCYIAGPNADTKKMPSWVRAEIDRYTAQVAGVLIDERDGWIKK